MSHRPRSGNGRLETGHTRRRKEARHRVTAWKARLAEVRKLVASGRYQPPRPIGRGRNRELLAQMRRINPAIRTVWGAKKLQRRRAREATRREAAP